MNSHIDDLISTMWWQQNSSYVAIAGNVGEQRTSPSHIFLLGLCMNCIPAIECAKSEGCQTKQRGTVDWARQHTHMKCVQGSATPYNGF